MTVDVGTVLLDEVSLPVVPLLLDGKSLEASFASLPVVVLLLDGGSLDVSFVVGRLFSGVTSLLAGADGAAASLLPGVVVTGGLMTGGVALFGVGPLAVGPADVFPPGL